MKRSSSWFNPIANKVIDRAGADAVEEEDTDESHESDDVTPQSGREVANAMIESSPSQFAFYTKAGVIDKMTFSTVDFQNAYNQIPVEPTTF